MASLAALSQANSAATTGLATIQGVAGLFGSIEREVKQARAAHRLKKAQANSSGVAWGGTASSQSTANGAAMGQMVEHLKAAVSSRTPMSIVDGLFANKSADALADQADTLSIRSGVNSVYSVINGSAGSQLQPTPLTDGTIGGVRSWAKTNIIDNLGKFDKMGVYTDTIQGAIRDVERISKQHMSSTAVGPEGGWSDINQANMSNADIASLARAKGVLESVSIPESTAGDVSFVDNQTAKPKVPVLNATDNIGGAASGFIGTAGLGKTTGAPPDVDAALWTGAGARGAIKAQDSMTVFVGASLAVPGKSVGNHRLESSVSTQTQKHTSFGYQWCAAPSLVLGRAYGVSRGQGFGAWGDDADGITTKHATGNISGQNSKPLGCSWLEQMLMFSGPTTLNPTCPKGLNLRPCEHIGAAVRTMATLPDQVNSTSTFEVGYQRNWLGLGAPSPLTFNTHQMPDTTDWIAAPVQSDSDAFLVNQGWMLDSELQPWVIGEFDMPDYDVAMATNSAAAGDPPSGIPPALWPWAKTEKLTNRVNTSHIGARLFDNGIAMGDCAPPLSTYPCSFAVGEFGETSIEKPLATLMAGSKADTVDWNKRAMFPSENESVGLDITGSATIGSSSLSPTVEGSMVMPVMIKPEQMRNGVIIPNAVGDYVWNNPSMDSSPAFPFNISRGKNMTWNDIQQPDGYPGGDPSDPTKEGLIPPAGYNYTFSEHVETDAELRASENSFDLDVGSIDFHQKHGPGNSEQTSMLNENRISATLRYKIEMAEFGDTVEADKFFLVFLTTSKSGFVGMQQLALNFSGVKYVNIRVPQLEPTNVLPVLCATSDAIFWTKIKAKKGFQNGVTKFYTSPTRPMKHNVPWIHDTTTPAGGALHATPDSPWSVMEDTKLIDPADGEGITKSLTAVFDIRNANLKTNKSGALTEETWIQNLPTGELDDLKSFFQLDQRTDPGILTWDAHKNMSVNTAGVVFKIEPQKGMVHEGTGGTEHCFDGSPVDTTNQVADYKSINALYKKALITAGGTSLAGGARLSKQDVAGSRANAIQSMGFTAKYADEDHVLRHRAAVAIGSGCDEKTLHGWANSVSTTMPKDDPHGDWSWMLVAPYALLSTGERFRFYPLSTSTHTGAAPSLARLRDAIIQFGTTMNQVDGQPEIMSVWDAIGKEQPMKSGIQEVNDLRAAMTGVRNALGPKTNIIAIMKEMTQDKYWAETAADYVGLKEQKAVTGVSPYTFSITDAQFDAILNVTSGDVAHAITSPGSTENQTFIGQHRPDGAGF